MMVCLRSCKMCERVPFHKSTHICVNTIVTGHNHVHFFDGTAFGGLTVNKQQWEAML